MPDIGFTLSFEGNDADSHELDFYDAAESMAGFQRSLALTTHLILNGEVITQAPSLKGATIFVTAPEPGSLQIPTRFVIASTFLAGAYALGTAPKETLIGHLIFSAYDYIISETLGFHVDFNKPLGKHYDEMQRTGETNLPILEQSQFDSVIEKCENSIREMHRPIIKSKTARSARILFKYGEEKKPFEHTIEDDEILKITCRVSSYNINTYKGRIYVLEEKRPIPFILNESIRNEETIDKITNSLRKNARENFIDQANVECTVTKYRSSTGRLKGYRLLNIS